jgi:hypothetical protein
MEMLYEKARELLISPSIACYDDAHTSIRLRDSASNGRIGRINTLFTPVQQ